MSDTHACGGFHAHDHTLCVQDALEQAEQYCREHSLRLTELRKRVLELIWQGHQPVGAYDLLDNLKAEGRNAQPPTVYRSLDFLLEHHLIHRLASLNAYIGCTHPGDTHHPLFFICERCGNASELDNDELSDTVSAEAQRIGFLVQEQTLELRGVCSHCQEQHAE